MAVETHFESWKTKKKEETHLLVLRKVEHNLRSVYSTGVDHAPT